MCRSFYLLGFVFVFVSFMGILSISCGSPPTTPSSATPTPTPNVLNLTGSFYGPYIDSAYNSDTGNMIWNLTQTGAHISGTCAIGFQGLGGTEDGTVSGTLTGTTLSFTILIPVGGYTAYPSCSFSMSGTASNVTNATIYSTLNFVACNANNATGSFTIQKQ